MVHTDPFLIDCICNQCIFRAAQHDIGGTAGYGRRCHTPAKGETPANRMGVSRYGCRDTPWVHFGENERA